MATPIISERSAPQIRALQTTPLSGPIGLERLTNTEAKQIVGELRAWAGQFHHPEAEKLNAALRDVERLFVRVGTEIDEALWMLTSADSLAGNDKAKAEEYRQAGLSYLHRWQDRNGRIGNVG